MATEPPMRLLPDAKESYGILPWVIAVMVYLCALAIAGGFGLRGAASGWTADLAQKATLQISAPDSAIRDKMANLALTAVTHLDGVANAQLVSKAQIASLLEPWLGVGNVTDDLPVPALIDITLTSNASNVQLAAIETQIKAIVPSARLDTHQQWLGELTTLTQSIGWTANLIVLLVALATVAIVAFGTRGGLSSHRPTIEILHMMGAPDVLIANEFQRRFLIQGLIGGVLGLVAGLITIIGLGWLAQRAGQGLIASVSLSPFVWICLLLLPVFAAALTMLTARITVFRALREIL